MPHKKTKRDTTPANPPADTAEPDQRRSRKGASGLSGRGAESVLVHLQEQEKTRARKPERS